MCVYMYIRTHVYVTESICKNQSYLHVKFDLILSLSSLITLFPNIVLYQKFHHFSRLTIVSLDLWYVEF